MTRFPPRQMCLSVTEAARSSVQLMMETGAPGYGCHGNKRTGERSLHN